MFDTSADGIRKFIDQGESETSEFKSHFTADRAVARDLMAFANTRGGITLFGIGDRNDVIGLTADEAEFTKRRLRSLASSLFTPEMYSIGSVSVDGKPVVYITVESRERQEDPTLTSTGEIYVRRGNHTVRVEHSEPRAEPKKTARAIRIFVAMSFRDEEEPSLADYYGAIRRAAAATQLPIEVFRIDQVDGDFEISQQIMKEIDKADAVLADFTLSPENVYFEAGYARGRSLRIIQTARKGTRLQFDVQNWRTEFYRNATELEEKLVQVFKRLYSDITTSE